MAGGRLCKTAVFSAGILGYKHAYINRMCVIYSICTCKSTSKSITIFENIYFFEFFFTFIFGQGYLASYLIKRVEIFQR